MLGKILVCDDSDIVRTVVAATLRRKFYAVTEVESGEAALEAIARDQPDILISDVMMDGMDGFRLCAEIKGRAEFRAVSVVLVTALSAQSDRNRGIMLGADDFITKPVQPAFLGARVRNLMRMRSLREELAERHAGFANEGSCASVDPPPGAFVIVAGDEGDRRVCELLERDLDMSAALAPSGAALFQQAAENDAHALVVNAATFPDFSLELCLALREFGRTRRAASLAFAPAGESALSAQILDAGIGDVCETPFDVWEFEFRMRAQLREAEHRRRLSMTLDEEIAAGSVDALTGLRNRRHFERVSPGLVDRAANENIPVAVAAFDLDRFKSVNDVHGHAAGDRVLREFARRLRDSCRVDDVALRLGGEEFLLLMPGCPPQEAAQAAERIRAAVASEPFDIDGGRLDVTVSVGVAVMAPTDDMDAVAQRADEALYAAKAQGRNRVIAA